MRHKILLILICLFGINFTARTQSQPLDISLANIQTVAEEFALQLLINYSENVTDVFIVPKEKNWYVDLSPSIHIMTGTEDAFSSIEAKISGNFVNFDTLTVGGIHGVPNSAGFFNVFPVSAGIETNKQFDNINGLLEIGYIPWYQNMKTLPQIMQNSSVSIFVQGGYKFKSSDSDSLFTGTGNEIQGKELTEDAILRLKTNIEFNLNNNHLKSEPQTLFLPIGITGKSNMWFDLLNNEIYYNITGMAHLYLQPDKSIDFFYEKGSGAPNFHQGEQFGVGLTLRY